MAKLQLFMILAFLAFPAFAATEPEMHDQYGAHSEYAAEGGVEGAHVDHHETTAGLPQLDLTWFPSQIFWLGIAFTILYIAFANKIVPAISANLETREQTIQNDLDSAEKLTQEATDFQKSYEESLQNARMESTAMMTALEDEMRQEHEKKQAEFSKKTEKQVSETKDRLEKMTDKSIKEVEKHIEEAALIAAKNIAGIDTDGKAVKAALKAVNSNIKAEAA